MVQQLRWEGELAIEKLARLLALLEDRESLTLAIYECSYLTRDAAGKLADRLASYIKERL